MMASERAHIIAFLLLRLQWLELAPLNCKTMFNQLVLYINVHLLLKRLYPRLKPLRLAILELLKLFKTQDRNTNPVL